MKKISNIGKNQLVLILMVVILSILSDYYQWNTGVYWLSMIGGIIVWLIITPFKLYNDA